MDGWMCRDFLPPIDFLFFSSYNNKQLALISKKYLKVFYKYLKNLRAISLPENGNVNFNGKSSQPSRNFVIFRKKCNKRTIISATKHEKKIRSKNNLKTCIRAIKQELCPDLNLRTIFIKGFPIILNIFVIFNFLLDFSLFETQLIVKRNV